MKKKSTDCHLSFHTLQNEECKYSDKFFRILPGDFPEKKYESGTGHDKTTIHYGQRKLHLSEVEFLTIVSNLIPEDDRQVVLIYAGAAPGVHTPVLAAMFPYVRFVLVDPAPFKLRATNMIELRNEYFTDAMAAELYEKYKDDSKYIRLFVCDIRLVSLKDMNTEQVEARVEEDMVSQMNWHKIIKPTKSLLKFRLPFVGDNPNAKRMLEYLAGDIYLQIWPGQTSSETRLLVDRDAPMKEYDCIKYENQCYHFNKVERVMSYQHNIVCPGIDHCYDCRAEIYVHEEYERVIDKVNRLCAVKGIKLKYAIPHRKIVYYIEKLNKELHADKRYFSVRYKGVYYDLHFTDIQYGKSADEILKHAKKTSIEKKEQV